MRVSSSEPSSSVARIAEKSVVPPPTSTTSNTSPGFSSLRQPSPRACVQAYTAACGSSSKVTSSRPAASAASTVSSRAVASNDAGTVSTTSASAASIFFTCARASLRCSSTRNDASTGEIFSTPSAARPAGQERAAPIDADVRQPALGAHHHATGGVLAAATGELAHGKMAVCVPRQRESGARLRVQDTQSLEGVAFRPGWSPWPAAEPRGARGWARDSAVSTRDSTLCVVPRSMPMR